MDEESERQVRKPRARRKRLEVSPFTAFVTGLTLALLAFLATGIAGDGEGSLLRAIVAILLIGIGLGVMMFMGPSLGRKGKSRWVSASVVAYGLVLCHFGLVILGVLGVLVAI